MTREELIKAIKEYNSRRDDIFCETTSDNDDGDNRWSKLDKHLKDSRFTELSNELASFMPELLTFSELKVGALFWIWDAPSFFQELCEACSSEAWEWIAYQAASEEDPWDEPFFFILEKFDSKTSLHLPNGAVLSFYTK